jgi:predicted dehydrogenase
MDRRIFLAGTAAAAAGLGHAAQTPPSDSIRVAIVGLRGRGRDHISAWIDEPGARIAALCDVDESLLQKYARQIESRGKPAPAAVPDFRRLLEDRSIDVVSIASPNHHHALQAIWACQAGKDVYVEKPCSHTIHEARQMVMAARRYNRIVQHGTQSRSIPVVREAIAQLHAGRIGDVYMARAVCYKWRDSIGRTPAEPVPPGVHYDLWMGPAPERPFSRNRFHYNWHWQWDYGNGEIGNQGIHEIDVARWGLGVRYPVRVSAMGGHVMFDDEQETPNHMTASFEFNDGGKTRSLVYEHRHWMANGEAGIGDSSGMATNAIGDIFYGCSGYMAIDGLDTNYKTWLGKERRAGPARAQSNGALDDLWYRMERRWGAAPARGGDHFGNFLSAVRARDRGKLNAEIEEGAISTTLVHLANISYRLRRTIEFDPKTLTCPDPEAQAMFTKPYRAPFVLPSLA